MNIILLYIHSVSFIFIIIYFIVIYFAAWLGKRHTLLHLVDVFCIYKDVLFMNKYLNITVN